MKTLSALLVVSAAWIVSTVSTPLPGKLNSILIAAHDDNVYVIDDAGDDGAATARRDVDNHVNKLNSILIAAHDDNVYVIDDAGEEGTGVARRGVDNHVNKLNSILIATHDDDVYVIDDAGEEVVQ